MNIIKGIGQGISNAAGGLWEAAKGVLGGFKDNVLGFFWYPLSFKMGDVMLLVNGSHEELQVE